MNFYNLCEKYLQDLGDEIEKKDIDSNLEIDYSDGILTIVIIANKKELQEDDVTSKKLDPTHFGDWQVNCKTIDF